MIKFRWHLSIDEAFFVVYATENKILTMTYGVCVSITGRVSRVRVIHYMSGISNMDGQVKNLG